MILSGTIRLKDEFSAVMGNAFKSTNTFSKELSRTDTAMTKTMAKMNVLGRVVMKPTVKLIDNASGTIGNITKSIFSLKGLVAGALGAGGLGLGIKGMLDASAFEEQAKVRLAVMLKSKDAANDAFEKARRFADITPFDTQGVISSLGTLVSSRFSTQDIFKGGLLQDVGNLAAANQDVGVNIQETAGVFGRLKAGDFGEAFQRLRELKIARQDLEEHGLKFDKGGSFTGTADQAITAVRAVIQKNFGGMMDEQSKTWSGLWSTFTSNAKNTLAAIGKYEVKSGVTVLGLFKNRLVQVTSLIVNDQGQLTPLAQSFVRNIGEAFGWVDRKIGETFTHIKNRYFNNPEFQRLDIAGKINFIMSDIGTGFKAWLDNGGGESIKAFGSDVGNFIGQGIMEVAPTLGKQAGEGLISAFAAGLRSSYLGAIILGALGGAAMGSVFPGVGTVLGALGGGISGGVTKLFTGGIEKGSKLAPGPRINPNAKTITPEQSSRLGGIPSNASGLSFVPYDNYLTRLHQGERVMTAEENRQYSGAKKPATILIQKLADRIDASNPADVDELLWKLEDRLIRVAMNMPS